MSRLVLIETYFTNRGIRGILSQQSSSQPRPFYGEFRGDFQWIFDVQRKCNFFFDFIYFLKFSDFWKGGGVFENPWKSGNRQDSNSKSWFIAIEEVSRDLSAREVLIFAYWQFHAYWISALQPCRIRLKKNSCLLASRSEVMSYSLKEKKLLIEINAPHHVICA